ncbi:MAG: hypothetical protein ACXAAR_02590 [Candidatus Thorarchaeota archaeon]
MRQREARRALFSLVAVMLFLFSMTYAGSTAAVPATTTAESSVRGLKKVPTSGGIRTATALAMSGRGTTGIGCLVLGLHLRYSTQMEVF